MLPRGLQGRDARELPSGAADAPTSLVWSSSSHLRKPSRFYLRFRRTLILRTLWQLRAEHPGNPSAADYSVDQWLAPAALGTVPTGVVLASGLPASCRMWIRAAEDFVAMRFTTYVYHVLNQIRLLLGFALGGALLLVWGTFSHPLQPQRLVTSFFGGILLLAAYSALSVIVGMQRNELLSNLAPAGHRGAFSFNRVQQVITYVLLRSAVLLSRVFLDFGVWRARAIAPAPSSRKPARPCGCVGRWAVGLTRGRASVWIACRSCRSVRSAMSRSPCYAAPIRGWYCWSSFSLRPLRGGSRRACDDTTGERSRGG